MFAYLEGRINDIENGFVVLDCHGIGFKIYVALPRLFKTGEELRIYVHPVIHENAFDLYGFKTKAEKEFFLKLLTVKGIGPKGALAILADDDPVGFEDAVRRSDARYLQHIPGIGPKSSSQIILDLRYKFKSLAQGNPKLIKVRDALRSLGYKSTEIRQFDDYLLSNQDLAIEELIKACLIFINKGQTNE